MLDWQDVLKKIAQSATALETRDQLLHLTKQDSPQAANEHCELVFSALELLSLGTRPHMESLDLFEPWFLRVKKQGVLKTNELRDVRSFCLETLALYESAEELPRNSLFKNQITNLLMDAEKPLSAIDQLMTAGGEIRSDASERLYGLFREKESLQKEITKTLDRLVHDHDMSGVLQDKYVTTREGRWVLPVRGGMKHSVPGVVHGSSQTKQTVFVEPGVVIPINNRLRQCELDIEEEIERLLFELSRFLFGLKVDFENTRKLLAKADHLLAIASFTDQVGAQRFHFTIDRIFLNEVRHPLLSLAQKEVVANSLELNTQKRILLLSGPNAGGKTVLLKSLGLALQMARFGLPICADESSRIPFIENITVALGDSQNLGENLSTFAAHLKILDSATQLSGLQNLILIDEICGSTDPEEGSALARSFIEAYAVNGVFALITSHLTPLKTGWSAEDPIMNGSMEYNLKTGLPTYQYLQGIPGDSLALQTAKRAGVSKAIIERATNHLSPIARIKAQAVDEMDRLKNDLQTLKDHYLKETKKAEFEQKKFLELKAQFEKERDSLLHKAVRDAERKIDELIVKVNVEQSFKKHRELQEIKLNLPQIVKAKAGSEAGLKLDTVSEFEKHFPPGSRVYVQSLSQDGLVQSAPNQKGEVTILSQSLRVTVSWKDLRPPQKAANPTADILRGGGVSVSFANQEKSLDLRGKTTEEAISHVELELDRCFHTREDRIRIVHGHGTEALKKAVRTYLSRSLYVKRWSAAPATQGGDGATWVEINLD